MKPALHIVAVVAWLTAALVPATSFCREPAAIVAALEAVPPVLESEVGVLNVPSAASSQVGTTLTGFSPDALGAMAQQGDAKAMIELGTRYAHAEGVPLDQKKANQLFCRAAKYGSADGLFHLGWAYANGRGVTRDEAASAALLRKAAQMGHAHAAKLLAVMPAGDDAKLPECALPAVLPIAVLPPVPPLSDEDLADAQLPMPPKEIMQLVNKLAPQFGVDANLALAVIYAESAFNPRALSPANAQGLMQLIPETAERFGVKQPFKLDENLRGGLAYLRWLLAYFQGRKTSRYSAL
jgi:hypothetical protein